MKTLTTIIGAGLLLSGCAWSPSINVLGAFFPDWMFCLCGALVLTAIFRVALRTCVPRLAAQTPSLAYFALCALCTLAAWVLIFQN